MFRQGPRAWSRWSGSKHGNAFPKVVRFSYADESTGATTNPNCRLVGFNPSVEHKHRENTSRSFGAAIQRISAHALTNISTSLRAIIRSIYGRAVPCIALPVPIPWNSPNRNHVLAILKRYETMDMSILRKREAYSSSIHGRCGHKETTPSTVNRIAGARLLMTDV
jgi:hypothetical protein